MMPLAIILLVIAVVAFIAWRKFGHSAPSSSGELHHPNAGDAAFLMYSAASQDEHHSPGDGHDHGAGADFSDSSDAGDAGSD